MEDKSLDQSDLVQRRKSFIEHFNDAKGRAGHGEWQSTPEELMTILLAQRGLTRVHRQNLEKVSLRSKGDIFLKVNKFSSGLFLAYGVFTIAGEIYAIKYAIKKVSNEQSQLNITLSRFNDDLSKIQEQSVFKRNIESAEVSYDENAAFDEIYRKELLKFGLHAINNGFEDGAFSITREITFNMLASIPTLNAIKENPKYIKELSQGAIGKANIAYIMLRLYMLAAHTKSIAVALKNDPRLGEHLTNTFSYKLKSLDKPVTNESLLEDIYLYQKQSLKSLKMSVPENMQKKLQKAVFHLLFINEAVKHHKEVYTLKCVLDTVITTIKGARNPITLVKRLKFLTDPDFYYVVLSAYGAFWSGANIGSFLYGVAKVSIEFVSNPMAYIKQKEWLNYFGKQYEKIKPYIAYYLVNLKPGVFFNFDVPVRIDWTKGIPELIQENHGISKEVQEKLSATKDRKLSHKYNRLKELYEGLKNASEAKEELNRELKTSKRKLNNGHGNKVKLNKKIASLNQKILQYTKEKKQLIKSINSKARGLVSIAHAMANRLKAKHTPFPSSLTFGNLFEKMTKMGSMSILKTRNGLFRSTGYSSASLSLFISAEIAVIYNAIKIQLYCHGSKLLFLVRLGGFLVSTAFWVVTAYAIWDCRQIVVNAIKELPQNIVDLFKYIDIEGNIKRIDLVFTEKGHELSHVIRKGLDSLEKYTGIKVNLFPSKFIQEIYFQDDTLNMNVFLGKRFQTVPRDLKSKDEYSKFIDANNLLIITKDQLNKFDWDTLILREKRSKIMVEVINDSKEVQGYIEWQIPHAYYYLTNGNVNGLEGVKPQISNYIAWVRNAENIELFKKIYISELPLIGFSKDSLIPQNIMAKTTKDDIIQFNNDGWSIKKSCTSGLYSSQRNDFVVYEKPEYQKRVDFLSKEINRLAAKRLISMPIYEAPLSDKFLIINSPDHNKLIQYQKELKDLYQDNYIIHPFFSPSLFAKPERKSQLPFSGTKGLDRSPMGLNHGK